MTSVLQLNTVFTSGHDITHTSRISTKSIAEGATASAYFGVIGDPFD
jgi:hypothetical protein